MSDIIAVNEKGVQLLRACSTQIEEEMNKITVASATLVDNTGTDGLQGYGPHGDKFLKLLKAVSETLKDSGKSVFDFCEALNDLADDYQAIIDDDSIFNGLGN